jgi:hypothetical protein
MPPPKLQGSVRWTNSCPHCQKKRADEPEPIRLACVSRVRALSRWIWSTDAQRTLAALADSRTTASREFVGISSVLSGTGPPSGLKIRNRRQSTDVCGGTDPKMSLLWGA